MFTGFPIGDIVTILICLIVAITIHEFMHAYVGYKLGDDTALVHGRLSFNPLNHIDPLMTIALPAITLLLFQFPFLAAKPVPFDPRNVRYGEYGAALLAAAGPLSNLALAFLSALALRYIELGPAVGHVVLFFAQLNVALFIFNLIPIPPLDGSRVLYAFAPEALQNIMRQIEPIGFFIIFGLVLWGGAGGFLARLNEMVLHWLPLPFPL